VIDDQVSQEALSLDKPVVVSFFRDLLLAVYYVDLLSFHHESGYSLKAICFSVFQAVQPVQRAHSELLSVLQFLLLVE
jgi:hypothetical protein